MVYKTTSIKPIIARIIRNTRITDMTYADDMMEWIGEGLNRMMIRWRLEKTNKVLEIKNHSAKLPCGLVTLNAVIANGQRLRKGTSSIDVRIKNNIVSTDDLATYFVHDTTIKPEDLNQQNFQLLRGEDIKMEASLLIGAFYDLQYDYIKTSFCDGYVTIAYTVAPVDKEGYPLAPDLEETREALFWYVCSRLCFTGYKLPDPSMDFKFCDKQATKFFRKAKNIIKEQSVDEKEAQVQLLNNLIPPDNYYSTFFMSGEQRKYVR
jgi:hypothetical protein